MCGVFKILQQVKHTETLELSSLITYSIKKNESLFDGISLNIKNVSERKLVSCAYTSRKLVSKPTIKTQEAHHMNIDCQTLQCVYSITQALINETRQEMYV
jgi:hypothetical protein